MLIDHARRQGVRRPICKSASKADPTNSNHSSTCGADRHPETPRRMTSGTTNLSVTPKRPACPSRASGWSSLPTPWGFQCCVRFPSCACYRQYPGAAAGRRLRSSRPTVSTFPERAIGSACTSSFSRLARRSLALRPAHSRRHLYVTRFTEGFSHFVTSMTAPVAFGWSVRRVGKRRLLTAHANSGPSRRRIVRVEAHFDRSALVGRIGHQTTIPRLSQRTGEAQRHLVKSPWAALR